MEHSTFQPPQAAGTPTAQTTFFAPAERKDATALKKDLRRVAENDLINGLMSLASGLFAVLNEQRQVLALNDSFLKQIGIDDPAELLGLRPGECLRCVHAKEMPGGCGTSQYCITCGAAIATLAALSTHEPQESTCALSVQREEDLYFNVRACPVTIDGDKYLLLFMQDITAEQHRACLDRVFFHDINNMLCGVMGKSYLLRCQDLDAKEKIEDIRHLVKRIGQEVGIHVAFQKSTQCAYQPLYTRVNVNTLLKDIERLFRDHTVCRTKELEVVYTEDGMELKTDFHLVHRILANMVTNALEATEETGKVVLKCTFDGDTVSFCVWNRECIPEHIARRIFQLNFSTKGKLGRGFGTYSMKLFAERLGGKVFFETGPESGTTFTLALPVAGE